MFLITFNVNLLNNLTSAHKLNSKNLRSEISILTIKQEFERAKVVRLKKTASKKSAKGMHGELKTT